MLGYNVYTERDIALVAATGTTIFKTDVEL